MNGVHRWVCFYSCAPDVSTSEGQVLTHTHITRMELVLNKYIPFHFISLNQALSVFGYNNMNRTMRPS